TTADLVMVHGLGSQAPGWSKSAADQDWQDLIGSYLGFDPAFNWNLVEDNWSTPAPPVPTVTRIAFKAEVSNQYAQTLLSVFHHRAMSTLDLPTLLGYAKSLTLDLSHNFTEVMNYILSGT